LSRERERAAIQLTWLVNTLFTYFIFTSTSMSFLTRLPRAAPAFKRAYATVADASGVKVAGVESAAPAATSSVTVVVKAGSRYETKPGAAHVLKSFAFKVGSFMSRSECWITDNVVDRVGICVEDS